MTPPVNEFTHCWSKTKFVSDTELRLNSNKPLTCLLLLLLLLFSSLPADLRAGRPLRADGQSGGADEAAQRHHRLCLLTLDPLTSGPRQLPSPPPLLRRHVPSLKAVKVTWFPHATSHVLGWVTPPFSRRSSQPQLSSAGTEWRDGT